MIDLNGIYASIDDDKAFDQLANGIPVARGIRSAIFAELTMCGTAAFLRAPYTGRAQ